MAHWVMCRPSLEKFDGSPGESCGLLERLDDSLTGNTSSLERFDGSIVKC
jgi:hypothetical protein